MTKKDVLLFIKKHKFTVISTCGKNLIPESAAMAFYETEHLEIFFGTSNRSRKYKNILENNHVAFVFGWETDFLTVQYEGMAEEVKGQKREKYLVPYIKKHPLGAEFKDHPGQVYFKVTPTWIRFSDLSGEENKIYEFSF